jgi:hypothetical protein
MGLVWQGMTCGDCVVMWQAILWVGHGMMMVCCGVTGHLTLAQLLLAVAKM